MIRIVVYFLLGYFFTLLQTTVFPYIMPIGLRPDLLLVLCVYLGLHESYLRGGIISFLLGILLDVFSGNYPGLYGLALLMTFFIVRGAASRFNIESPLLLLFLVGGGTLVESGIIMFSLGYFAEAGALWTIVLPGLLGQTLLNLGFALVFLLTVSGLQRRHARALGIPGLNRLGVRHEP